MLRMLLLFVPLKILLLMVLLFILNRFFLILMIYNLLLRKIKIKDKRPMV